MGAGGEIQSAQIFFCHIWVYICHLKKKNLIYLYICDYTRALKTAIFDQKNADFQTLSRLCSHNFNAIALKTCTQRFFGTMNGKMRMCTQSEVDPQIRDGLINTFSCYQSK